MSATHFAGPVVSYGGFAGGMNAPKSGKFWYVNPNAGGSNDGTDWDNAFTTMAKALSYVFSGDTILFIGNIREQLVSPADIFDVTIIGCGNRPRHSDLIATGYGNYSQTSATWMPPVTASLAATTPVFKVIQQGWTFVNILFTWKSDSGTADAPLVMLFRDAGSGIAERDAGHASFYRCRFDGGLTGIEDSGGCYNVLIDDCFFRGITDGTGRAIYHTTTTVANALMWEIRNSRFIDNDNHIVAKASKWFIHNNIFSAASVTSKIDLTGGVAGNIITKNLLGGTYSNAGGYTAAGAADEWMGNWASTSPTVSDPA